ncbi:DUF4283 domain-containing protein [Raphanus sativus]|nr:DUF4283 domain-containing protein [Raphanus sativus]
MSLASPAPVLPPPPVPPDLPPDLLFLRPFPDPPSPQSPFFPSSSAILAGPSFFPLSLGAEEGCSVPPLVSVPPPSSLPLKPVLWVDKVKSSFQPLTKVASPTLAEDGIVSIRAPDSILLTSSDLWKDHLVAFFHGTPPSAAKVFNDLNPIWGVNGRISVKRHSNFSYLIYIPCVVSRKWALDVGFWHSGNCSFTVAAWYPSINLSSMKLVHAPVWVVFRKVPKELWSLVGFNTLASAVGLPVHSEFSDLKPYSNGVIKLRVVVELDKPRPSTVRISDKEDNSVLVSTEFPKMPPRCSGCGEYGHFRMRCPVPMAKSQKARRDSFGKGLAAHIEVQENQALANSIVHSSSDQPPIVQVPAPVASDEANSRKLIRSRSLPSQRNCSGKESSLVWMEVASRSKPKPKEPPSPHVPPAPVTTSKFAEEEELISSAQRILRARLEAVGTSKDVPSTSMSRKHARRKIRQQLFLLTSGDSGDGFSSADAASIKQKVFGLASGEQASLRSVHSQEA